MEYSVEELARYAGVSVRTLHYYDEIGLLSPPIRMANGRRVYFTEQAILLGEILFFKGMGLSLKQIHSVLAKSSRDRVAVLLKQQKMVHLEMDRLKEVDVSIKRAIEHYKGCPMSKEEVKHYFKTSMERFSDSLREVFGPEELQQRMEEAENLSPEELQRIKVSYEDWNQRFVELLNRGCKASAPEVQSLIEESYQQSPRPEKDPEEARKAFLKGREFFRPKSYPADLLHRYHPDYARVLYDGMGIFAQRYFQS